MGKDGLSIGPDWAPLVFGQASQRACSPVTEQKDEAGPACFTAKMYLGELPAQPLFWYLSTYPTRVAAKRAKDSRSPVVESLGKVWLFTVAEAGWSARGGNFVKRIGPLPLQPDVKYEAVYMQSIFDPGMTAPLHVHSGPEAFYTLTGETCLETPEGVQTGSGEGHVNLVPGGPPMLLKAMGTEKRRGVVLILHDTSQPATTMDHRWMPRGLCK